MSVKNRNELKGYFLTGKRPTQGQFANLVDSLVHKSQDIMIDASGRVGIGTTAPSEKLEVRGGNIKIATTDHSLTLEPNDIKFNKNSSFSYISNFGNGGLAFTTGGGSSNTRLVIDNSGNIGINKIDPTARLEILGGPTWTINSWYKAIKLNDANALQFDSSGLKADGNPSITRFGVGARSGNEMLYYFTSNGDNASSDCKYYMTVNNNGQIGIGWQEQWNDFHLHYNKTFGIGPWEISQEGGNDVTSYLRIERWTGDGVSRWKNKMVTIDWSGNMSLRGDVRPNIDPANMPDYVFEEEYDLLPLEKLEAFIQKEKHLPEIPSKIDVEADGVMLGDLSIKLLKKVEELTLYVLQQNKEIQQLKQQKLK